MDVQSALKSQYHAALAESRETIERCPEDLWLAGEHPRGYWRIAYHALFFAHLYLQPSESAFRAWDRHLDESQFLDALPWPPHDMPKAVAPYSRQAVLDYWQICDAMIDDGVDRLDLDAPECGFWWYDMPKLDHQIMSIRHVQQHAGQLFERLCAAAVDPGDWVGGRRAT